MFASLSKMHLCFFATLFLFASCQKEAQQHLADIQLINDYITDNNIDAIEDSEANFFYSIDTLPVIGDTITPKRNIGIFVEVNYTASLLDGTVVHDTNGSSVIVELDNAIFGWQLAMPKIAIGQKMLLLLPSRLAYGDEGAVSIPPNSILIFDIELLDVHPHF